MVAREVIDALLAASKHNITILSRNVSIPSTLLHYTTLTNRAQEASIEHAPPGVHWRVVNYNDQSDLVEALRGTHTLLSFVQLLSDQVSEESHRCRNCCRRETLCAKRIRKVIYHER